MELVTFFVFIIAAYIYAMRIREVNLGNYNTAVEYMNNSDYNNAIIYFEKSGFSNYKEKITECHIKLGHSVCPYCGQCLDEVE